MSSRNEMESEIIESTDDSNNNDDASKSAPSEELKQTLILDKVSDNSQQNAPPRNFKIEDKSQSDRQKNIISDVEIATHADIISHEEVAEDNSSPKKKRHRDQDESVKSKNDNDLNDPEAAHASVVEPEKKRPRDMSTGHSNLPGKETNVVHDELTTKKDCQDLHKNSEKNMLLAKDGSGERTLTFASSGFASMATSKTSPFGSLGAAKSSVFGGTGLKAGFGSLSTGKEPAGLADCKTSSESDSPAKEGFFGSKLGSTFGSVTGPRLLSFAEPGMENKPLTSKTVKVFGAPESEDDETPTKAVGPDVNNQNISEDECSHFGSDEKKKIKTSKVQIDDGETGEVTLLQIRAKLFALESKAVGWKERGVGTLKINVPMSSVSYHENGAPVLGSFDKSKLEPSDNDTGSHLARLIMRQENTHRVILNTFIIREMEFEEKSAVSSSQIVFTALEGEKELKPIKMLLKMSEANAKLFRSEIDSIQYGLGEH